MSSPGLNVCPPEEPWQRPRVVTFYKNGDRSFRGKALRIPARRYLSLEALLVELSRWVPLANGVRRLYSPRGGRAVRSLAELRDGHGYVCAAFEPFRGGWYGPEAPGAAASGTEKQALFDDLSSELQEDNLQAIYPPIGRGTFGQSLPGATNRNTLLHKRGCCHAIHSDTIPAKPRIMTIIKASGQSHKKVTILLNRYCTQTFEQLISDIAEAMRHLHGKGECVKKLYNLKGKEVRSISDFYRGDDVFIAAGREQITMSDIKKVLRELYPKNPYAWSLIQRHWCHSEKPPYRRSEMRFKNAEVAQSEKQIAKKMEEVRTRVGQQERERARKWEQERWAREYRELDEIARQQKNDGNFDRDKEEMDKYQINKKEKKHKSKEKSRGTEKDIETYERGGKRVEEMKILQVGRTEWEEDGIEANSKQKMSYEFKEMERREVARNRNKWKEDKCDNEGEQPMKNIRWEQKSIKAEGETDKWDKVKPERQQGQKEDHQWRTEDKSHALRDENCKMSKQEDTKKCCCGQETSRDEEEQTWNDEEVEKAQNQPVKTIRMEQPLIKDHSIHSRETQLLMSRPQQSQPRREIEHYYEIGRTIGDGNFALVKECRLRNTEYEYAVKIIDKSKLKGKEVMIENEIAIVRSLSHPHIVRFIEEFETEGEIYLIMEYIHGGDLFDAITDSVKFTESNAALMMDNLCDALAYIHRKNIVHRDLKPENLLVQHKADGSPVLKLADFGLALKVTSPIFTVCGTPTYVAPEILSEKGYGFEVDMWATGVILYILLCGFPPFRSLERDQEELFEMIQLGEYEFLSPYWDSISDGAKDLVSKLLVVNPRNRYTAQQVLKHAWIWSAAKRNTHNLQREVSMNIGQHFRRCRRQEILNSATQRPSLRC